MLRLACLMKATLHVCLFQDLIIPYPTPSSYLLDILGHVHAIRAQHVKDVHHGEPAGQVQHRDVEVDADLHISRTG